MYQLIEETLVGKAKRLTRTYRNENGSEVRTALIYTNPRDKSEWYGFTDLLQIPMQRKAMASYIVNLYGVGLSIKDILDWCEQEKKILKSSDADKYEKLYALVLEKQNIATFTADPIKQGIALATVYILAKDERIDTFSPAESEQKMFLWGGMPEAVGFFLSWQNDHIAGYMKRFDKASQTVSKLEKLTNPIQQQKP